MEQTILWPTINAGLNAIAAALLIKGRHIIVNNRHHIDQHRQWMAGAFSVSTIFLISYLCYHFTNTLVTRYQGTGFLRGLYFTVLISHSILAVVTAPGAIAALATGWRGNYQTHLKIVRWIWPCWVYVSVTGVMVYLMLYIL